MTAADRCGAKQAKCNGRSPWPDRDGFTRTTSISPGTTVTPLSYIPCPEWHEWAERAVIKKKTAETNAGEVGVAGTCRIAVLREAFREQSLFGGRRCSSVRAVRLQSSAPLKGASGESLDCCLSAASTYCFRARGQDSKIPRFLRFHKCHFYFRAMSRNPQNRSSKKMTSSTDTVLGL